MGLFAAVNFARAVRSSQDLEKERYIKTLHYTEPVKLAAAQKIEGAKGLFQVSMLVVGVLWSLIVAKRDEKAMLLHDRPELIMFVIANALFVCKPHSRHRTSRRAPSHSPACRSAC